MLRRIYIPLVLVLLLTVFSCSKKTEKPVLDDPYAVRIDLSNKDTVEVSNLVNQYFERLKARDIDGALSMIYYLKGDSIVDVPESIRSKQRMALQMFCGKLLIRGLRSLASASGFSFFLRTVKNLRAYRGLDFFPDRLYGSRIRTDP